MMGDEGVNDGAENSHDPGSLPRSASRWEDAVRWLNELPVGRARHGGWSSRPMTATDFWRITGYGYVRDNGHLYGETLAGDFDLSMRVRGGLYADQYDQAGAMVRVDERRWLEDRHRVLRGPDAVQHGRHPRVFELGRGRSSLRRRRAQPAAQSGAATPSRSATRPWRWSAAGRHRVSPAAGRGSWPAPCARHPRGGGFQVTFLRSRDHIPLAFEKTALARTTRCSPQCR